MFVVADNIKSVPGNNGITLFNLNTLETQSLNLIASFIWQHLHDGSSFVTIVEALAEATKADPREIERDVWNFIYHMMNQGVVTLKINDDSARLSGSTITAVR